MPEWIKSADRLPLQPGLYNCRGIDGGEFKNFLGKTRTGELVWVDKRRSVVEWQENDELHETPKKK